MPKYFSKIEVCDRFLHSPKYGDACNLFFLLYNNTTSPNQWILEPSVESTHIYVYMIWLYITASSRLPYWPLTKVSRPIVGAMPVACCVRRTPSVARRGAVSGWRRSRHIATAAISSGSEFVARYLLNIERLTPDSRAPAEGGLCWPYVVLAWTEC